MIKDCIYNLRLMDRMLDGHGNIEQSRISCRYWLLKTIAELEKLPIPLATHGERVEARQKKKASTPPSVRTLTKC